MGGLEILAVMALVASPAPGGPALVPVSTAVAETLSRLPASERTRPAPIDSSIAGQPTHAGAPAGAATDTLPFRLRLLDTVASGTAAAELIEPSGLAHDAFGRLYVSDASLHRLVRYDAAGRWLGSSGALGSDVGQLHRPGAVALLGTLSIAVLDRENRRVVSYDLFGQPLGTLIDLGAADLEEVLGRVDPTALSADRGGAVYVLDQDRDRVLVFDFNGRFLRTLGGFGTRPGSFRGLAGLAAAPSGQLVTAERGGARVQRFDAGGRVAASWGLRVEPGRLALPVAVDDSLRVAVADERSGRLWVFDHSGRAQAEMSGLDGPRALVFAADGTLLVAEAAAGRVRRFAFERAVRPAATRDH